MTTERKRHVVADDVLGNLYRKFWDLTRRILEGGADAERAKFFLQTALEAPSKPNNESSRRYVLESHWAWDNFHYEFATISIEKYDGLFFESLLDSELTEKNKKELMEMLQQLHDGHQGHHGPTMVRLHRVLGRGYFGFSPHMNLGKWSERETVDLHFSLLPICDFDKAGNPIPCEFVKKPVAV